VGTSALFMDGGGDLSSYSSGAAGGACGVALHLFVALLIAVSYALLGLMSYVLMGFRVTIDINLPFQALVVIVGALGALWVFYGLLGVLPTVAAWLQQVAGGGATPACVAQQPLFFSAWGAGMRAGRPLVSFLGPFFSARSLLLAVLWLQ
jgi:hypothetical protein